MDGEGRWRMITCGGVGGGAQDKTIFNRIMLRFRPIAPKPANSCQDSSASLVENKSLVGSQRRAKRKYVRVSKSTRRYKRTQKRILSPSSNQVGEKDGEDDGGTSKVVTLQLLPERTDSSAREGSWCNNLDIDKEELAVDHHPQENREGHENGGPQHCQVQFVQHSHECVSAKEWTPLYTDTLEQHTWSGKLDNDIDQPLTDVSDDVADRRVVESWVIVESVTHAYTCMEGGRGLLGCRDVERVKSGLDEDTCPGFISDGWNRVEWVNRAYKRMARVAEEDGGRRLLRVWLVQRERKQLPCLCYSYQGFTCRVRLQHSWEREKCPQMVPCDVWRMAGGGFAWRLDVEAALTLGR